ncbi:MAG TPA: carboxypeptidase-like regulatory domain-containing protein [Fibrobacteria bacterium]|nr:carboxypeptidase-like regulatory domain-containing protein [Fibrobacteria bacterium]
MSRCVWVALCGILCGCGQSNLGGGGIEVPNGLTVTVTASTGEVLPGVKVRLLARESWTSRVDSALPLALDSAWTDAGGKVDFHLPAGEGAWVEAISGGQGTRVQTDSAGPVALALAPLSTLSGSLLTGPISGVRIRLGGSDRTTVTNSTGAFQFDSLPQGTWNLVAQPGKAFASLATVDLGLDSLSVQGLADDTSTLLLDDFTDGTNVWNLQGLFGDGYWWIQAAGPTNQVFGVAGAWDAVTGDGTIRWISIPVDLSGVANAWADAGLDLGTANGVLPELSQLQSVRIKYRGSGTWTFALVEQLADTTRSWTANLAMDTAWATTDIPVGSLSNPGQAWNSAPRHVRQMVFATSSSGKLEIAQVSLVGASLSNWGR